MNQFVIAKHGLMVLVILGCILETIDDWKATCY
jgi:hypothetical protein